MTQTAYITTLPSRGIIEVVGPDTNQFLQSLITNDLNALTQDAVLYSCLLTPQGKFLHDFFISFLKSKDGLRLECEGKERAQHLYQLLSKYKLRQDVELTCHEDVEVCSLLFEDKNMPWNIQDLAQQDIFKDPRHENMGFRCYSKPHLEEFLKNTEQKKQGISLEEKSFSYWDRNRIKLCIPDGSRDLMPEKSTLDEGRIQDLNGVSFDKGCYIGQEITARMHYRGLGKKHLYSVNLDNLPSGAELRSSCEDIGLALMKDP